LRNLLLCPTELALDQRINRAEPTIRAREEL
jgi:hypothetical protein